MHLVNFVSLELCQNIATPNAIHRSWGQPVLYYILFRIVALINI